MFTSDGKVWTDNIVENVVTISAMAFILDVRVQSCMGIPESTVYSHFKRMQKERNYKTEYGIYKMQLLRKMGSGDEKYFSVSSDVWKNGFADQYGIQRYHELIKGEKSTGSNKQGRKKSKRISLAVASMYESGILTFPRQKELPGINSNKNLKSDLIFYTSREVKVLDELKRGTQNDNEIKYGQYDGFLITPSKNFIVYVIDKWLFRFNIGSERKTQRFGMTKFSKIISIQSDRFMDALFILRSEKTFGDMLKRGDPDGGEKKYRTGGAFFHEYCIPLYRVKEILPLITKENHREIIRQKFFPSANKTQAFDYRDSFDGYWSREKVVLSGLSCDLGHIEKAMGYVQKLNTLKCVVLCFEWQYPYFVKVYGTDRIIYKKIALVSSLTEF